MSFLSIMLCCYFSLEAALQGVAKNNPTEKQIMHKFRRLLTMRKRENSQKGKSKVYHYKLQR